MADSLLTSRVTILAIGVSHYDDPHFQTLSGPKKDIECLHKLLVEDTSTALFSDNQFIDLLDPDANELRQFINEYIISRSAENDILLLYFSGHGVPIGRDDFGFCTTDTIVHSTTKIPLPLSVVKLSEILSSINIVNITPIVIIDACYSGIAGRTLRIPPVDAISSIRDQIHTISASSYAFLCSCTENQTTIDTPVGGVFSNYLSQVATEGLPISKCNEPLLTLRDIFNQLQERVLNYSGDITPRLYLGSTLPEFPFVANTKYHLHRYSLSNSFIRILEELWNNGEERILTPAQIRSLSNSNGAYGNHNKLSFTPWGLVETVPGSRSRRLSKRGKEFMRNELSVPKSIIQDPKTKNVVAAENTVFVKYSDFLE